MAGLLVPDILSYCDASRLVMKHRPDRLGEADSCANILLCPQWPHSLTLLPRSETRCYLSVVCVLTAKEPHPPPPNSNCRGLRSIFRPERGRCFFRPLKIVTEALSSIHNCRSASGSDDAHTGCFAPGVKCDGGRRRRRSASSASG